jgi:hypothetical protein
VLVDPSDHDVGDVMTDRVGIAQGECGFTQGRDPVQRPQAEVVHDVRDICGEQLTCSVQLARIREVAVEIDQVVDVDPVLLRQCHRGGPPSVGEPYQ